MSDKPRWVQMIERVEAAAKALRDAPSVETFASWNEAVGPREVLHLIHLVRLAQGGQKIAEQHASVWRERYESLAAEHYPDVRPKDGTTARSDLAREGQ